MEGSSRIEKRFRHESITMIMFISIGSFYNQHNRTDLYNTLHSFAYCSQIN